MSAAWWIRVLRLARPSMASMGGLLALILVGAAMDALRPWPLKWLVDQVLEPRSAASTGQWLTRLPGAATASGQIAYVAGATILIFVLCQLIRSAQNYLQTGLGSRATYTLGAKLFDHLQSLSLLFHTRRAAGDLVRRITTDAACARDMVLSVLVPVVTSVATLALMLVVMWRLDRTLTLVAITMAIPLGVLVRLLYRPMSRRADEEQAAQSEVMVLAERTLGAIPVVQTFGQEGANDLAFRGSSAGAVRAALATIVAQMQFKIGTGAVTALGSAVVMFVGGMHVLDGRLTLGSLLVFLAYLGSFYAPLEALAYVSTAFASAGASGRRVVEVLDSKERVSERHGAITLPRSSVKDGMTLTFDRVTFGYQKEITALSDVSLTIPAGKTLALVGRTGAGKSTLAAMVPRLIDPWDGRVLLDGHDLRDLTLASLRDAVAIVPQEPVLLPLTVHENIAYGRPGASDAQVRAAAEAAQAAEFIDRLPLGYQTVIGERGATLSAGQRQRLAIARALLRDAPVLLLDEPTSALDVMSESLLVAALRKLTAGRTCLIIAHRLSTVRDADLVAVLDHGKLIEFGPPAELLRSGGAFARFHELQTGQREHAPAAATVQT